MNQVRLAIVGTGVMGQGHLRNLAANHHVAIAAICDTDPETLQQVAAQYPQARAYENHQELLADDICDAVLIATPHYDHPLIAVDCFRKGLHVLSEKPLAVTTLAAKEALSVHARTPGLKYAVVFMARLYPLWQKVREILASGQIGEVRRASWIMTNWYRTQAYYDSGGWRATWAGEGGGVLINQCPHTLDIFTWLLGLPRRVTAQVGLGRHHAVEVEDSVNALLEYENGAIGSFYTSTGETPTTDRFEIFGDKGCMVIEKGQINLQWSEQSLRAYSDQTADLYRSPEMHCETFSPPNLQGFGHTEIVQNFVNSILFDEPLVCPASEGINSLALGNAFLLSGLKNCPVEIPFDDGEYARKIEVLAASSCYSKVIRRPSPENFADAVH